MKGNKIVLLVSLAVLLLPTVACGGTVQYLTHVDTVSGFSVSYPDDWERMPLGSAVALVGFSDPSC